jgi:hypothetical protein
MINYRKILEQEYKDLVFTYEGDNPDYDYSGIVCENLPTKTTLDALWNTKLKRAQDTWIEFEKQRSELLRSTDHFGLSDNTMTNEMSEYRQALRDLPMSQEPIYDNDGVFFIDWPVEPTE